VISISESRGFILLTVISPAVEVTVYPVYVVSIKFPSSVFIVTIVPTDGYVVRGFLIEFTIKATVLLAPI